MDQINNNLSEWLTDPLHRQFKFFVIHLPTSFLVEIKSLAKLLPRRLESWVNLSETEFRALTTL